MPLTDNITSSTVSRRSWCTLGGYSSSVWCNLPSGLCSSGRAYPTTVCRVARGRLSDLLDRHSSVLIEGKLRVARVSAAALHLCDDELIGPLRPQSYAQTVRLPARRYSSSDGRSEPLRLITCEQFDPCSGYRFRSISTWSADNSRARQIMAGSAQFFLLTQGLEPIIGSQCVSVTCWTYRMSTFPLTYIIYIYRIYITIICQQNGQDQDPTSVASKYWPTINLVAVKRSFQAETITLPAQFLRQWNCSSGFIRGIWAIKTWSQHLSLMHIYTLVI